MEKIVAKCGFSALGGYELILLRTNFGDGVAMGKFLGITGSIVLALAIADVGMGKAPVGGITVAPGGQALAADMPAPPPPHRSARRQG